MHWKQTVLSKTNLESSHANNTYLKKYGMAKLGKIRKRRKEGLTYKDIAEKMDIPVGTIYGICHKFGWKPKHWHGKRNKDGVWNKGTRGFYVKPLIEVKDYRNIKKRLIETGEREPICEHCGWDYRKHKWFDNLNTGNVPLHIHHKDGDRTNNKRENLQLLCPSCHAMTKNYAARNK